MNRGIFLAVALFCIGAHAQVVKCKDATGKVIYADRACPVNFNASSVNLSGANITENQILESQTRIANTGGGSEACPLLRERAERAFTRYQEVKNVNSANASLNALQNLANYCPSTETCKLIKSRATYAQQRHDEEGNRNTAAGLDSSLGLFAKYCQRNDSVRSTAATPSAGSNPEQSLNAAPATNFYTKDEFGNLVRSDKCFRTPDAFGVLRRSPGCSK